MIPVSEDASKHNDSHNRLQHFVTAAASPQVHSMFGAGVPVSLIAFTGCSVDRSDGRPKGSLCPLVSDLTPHPEVPGKLAQNR